MSRSYGDRVLQLADAHYSIPRSRRSAARPIIRGAWLRVNAGERVGIVGPNGEGKSTLLKILAGMLRLDGGTLTLGSVAADDLRRSYQRAVHLVAGAPLGFYPRLTASENLRFFSGLRGTDLSNDEAREVLDRVGLGDESIDTAYAKFSLGMRQRLHLAAALLDSRAVVWLLDEPTTGLDGAGIAFLEETLAGVGAISQILVSHDPGFLGRVCHRIVRLDGHALVD